MTDIKGNISVSRVYISARFTWRIL